MTEENHCYENGLTERVKEMLKDEYQLDVTFADCRQARRASCKEAIALYNTRRPRKRLRVCRVPEKVHHTAA